MIPKSGSRFSDQIMRPSKKTMPELAPGLVYVPDYFDAAEQAALVADVHAALRDAPLFTPRMPGNGNPFSVRMSNCGPLGWMSDRDGGYRYQATHPQTGAPWPAIPALALRAWGDLAPDAPAPEACLVNYYGEGARMGLHQDRDEADLSAPVVSLSLGDACLFRFGGERRKDATRSLRLRSGDAVVIGGASRLIFHGVDRIMSGTSTLLSEGGRFNLTLRRVSVPSPRSPGEG
jgi:alkylated DNA repair protein (DNA oxidative demethylase)